jgi:hypothetical protein
LHCLSPSENAIDRSLRLVLKQSLRSASFRQSDLRPATHRPPELSPLVTRQTPRFFPHPRDLRSGAGSALFMSGDLSTPLRQVRLNFAVTTVLTAIDRNSARFGAALDRDRGRAAPRLLRSCRGACRVFAHDHLALKRPRSQYRLQAGRQAAGVSQSPISIPDSAVQSRSVHRGRGGNSSKANPVCVGRGQKRGQVHLSGHLDVSPFSLAEPIPEVANNLNNSTVCRLTASNEVCRGSTDSSQSRARRFRV